MIRNALHCTVFPGEALFHAQILIARLSSTGSMAGNENHHDGTDINACARSNRQDVVVTSDDSFKPVKRLQNSVVKQCC